MNCRLDVAHVSAIKVINEYLNTFSDISNGRKRIVPKSEDLEFSFDIKHAALVATKAIRNYPDEPPLVTLELLKAQCENDMYHCKNDRNQRIFLHYMDAIDVMIDFLNGGYSNEG